MKNLLLTLLSTVIGLLCLEGALRLALEPSQLYSSFDVLPERNQWRNEVQFWEKYRDSVEADFNSFDPLLGWDFQSGERRFAGAADISTVRRPGRLRILTIGDSFVWGNEVDSYENFSALLAARLPTAEVLNMGVPGYGIDQAYLKYRHFGAPYRPDLVVFGIYTSDYERSSMSFSTFAKPRFVLEGDEVSLTNQPVPPPSIELARIGAALEGRWWLIELIKNAAAKLAVRESDTQRYLSSMDRVVSHLLTDLAESLSPQQRLLIIHIPRAEAFLAPDPLEAMVESHLRGIYAALELPVIDLGDAFLRDATPEEVVASHYVHRPNGSIGHLSALGHARIADLLESWLQQPAAMGIMRPPDNTPARMAGTQGDSG